MLDNPQANAGMIQCESAVLGTVLRKPEMLPQLNLSPDDFEVPQYRTLYNTIITMANRAESIDAISVGLTLNDLQLTQLAAEAQSLAMNDLWTDKATLDFASKLRNRAAGKSAKQVAQRLLDSNANNDAIAVAMAELASIGVGYRNYDHTVGEALTAAIHSIEEANDRGSAVEITTGLADLDSILGGWHNTDLTVVGARPAMGKTSLLLNFADNCQVPCGVVSSEQPANQIGMRLLAIRGKVALEKMRSAMLDDQEYALIGHSLQSLEQRMINIYDKPGPSIGEVVQQARKWRLSDGIKILFIDYIQRIRASDLRKPKHEQVEEVTTTLKNLARDLEIPVVALAQVNRNVEARNDKRPLMGDLKDSGAIEQEADQIITLYRDDVYNSDSEFKGIAELNICKNRHGASGGIRTVWIPEYLQFKDLSSYGDWAMG